MSLFYTFLLYNHRTCKQIMLLLMLQKMLKTSLNYKESHSKTLHGISIQCPHCFPTLSKLASQLMGCCIIFFKCVLFILMGLPIFHIITRIYINPSSGKGTIHTKHITSPSQSKHREMASHTHTHIHTEGRCQSHKLTVCMFSCRRKPMHGA